MKKGIAVLASVGAVVALAVPSLSSGQGSGLPSVDIAVGGGTLTVGGTPQSGALTVNITNSAKKKPASVILFKFRPGVTYDQLGPVFSDAGDDPNVVTPFGSILFDTTANPGATSIDTRLPEGNYTAVDVSGNNPANWPHAEFTVGKAATEPALPSAKATVSSLDFGFKAPKSIKRGSVVRFQQTGNVMHMIAAIKVKNAFVAKQAIKLFKAGKDKKVNKLARGFAGFLDPASGGTVQQQTVDAAPGQYVLACFLPTQDGRPHTSLGMVRALKITK